MKQFDIDPTEGMRREMVMDINRDPNGREALEEKHGQVWDTDQMTRDFSAIGFMAPFISVKRKSDGVRGLLMFQHQPRFYFNFTEA
jgi:hypothetical protein